MTDYEMLSVFTEFWNIIWVIFATYLSVTFAFLVVGYLVATKLKPMMVSLIVALYSLVALWCTFGINRFVVNAPELSREIKRAVVESESTLGWSAVATTPEFVISAIPIILLVLTVAAYAGSVAFSFHQRKNAS